MRELKKVLTKSNRRLYNRAESRPHWIEPAYFLSLSAQQIGIDAQVIVFMRKEGILSLTNPEVLYADARKIEGTVNLPKGENIEKVHSYPQKVSYPCFIRVSSDEGTFTFGTKNPYLQTPEPLTADIAYHLGLAESA